MKNFSVIAFVLTICIAVWGMVIWKMAQDNGIEETFMSKPILEEVEVVELVPTSSEHYHSKGITKEDAQLISPDGEISVDELLELIQ